MINAEYVGKVYILQTMDLNCVSSVVLLYAMRVLKCLRK